MGRAGWRVQFGVELPLYFGLSSVDYTGMLRAEWLKADATNSEATVQAHVVEWPKTKWRVRLELFGKDERPAGYGEIMAENGGWIVSRPAHGKRQFNIPLKDIGSGTGAPQRFRLLVETIAGPT